MAELIFKPFAFPKKHDTRETKLTLKPFALAKKIRAEEWAKALGIRKKPARSFDESKINAWFEEKEAEKQRVIEEKKQRRQAREALTLLKYRGLTYLLKSKVINTKGRKDELLRRAKGKFTCEEISSAMEKLQKEAEAKQRRRRLKSWDVSGQNWQSPKIKELSSKDWVKPQVSLTKI